MATCTKCDGICWITHDRGDTYPCPECNKDGSIKPPIYGAGPLNPIDPDIDWRTALTGLLKSLTKLVDTATEEIKNHNKQT